MSFEDITLFIETTPDYQGKPLEELHLTLTIQVVSLKATNHPSNVYKNYVIDAAQIPLIDENGEEITRKGILKVAEFMLLQLKEIFPELSDVSMGFPTRFSGVVR